MHEDDCMIWFEMSQNNYDNDKIPYWVEIEVLKTNPVNKDSNNNGINDGDKDYDKDGTTNYQELRMGGELRVKDIFGFHLTVSANFDIDKDYFSKLVKCFQKTSEYIYDYTDGKAIISIVRIHDNSMKWNGADIRIGKGVADELNDPYWPHVPLEGLGGYFTKKEKIYLPEKLDPDGKYGVPPASNTR